MYALIQKDDGLPSVVNCNSFYFPDFIQSGYEVLKEGTKREMDEKFDEIIIEFAEAID